MNITTLTSSDMVTESIVKGLQAAFTLAAIGWIIGLLILIGTVALITWVVKKVWYAGSNRRYRKEQKAIRRAERNVTTTQIQVQGYVKNGQLYSPTGWRWDEDAKLWVPPKNLK